jgi:ABC-2 type transport system permease protein
MTARTVARPAVLWGLVFGATAAATMSTFDSAFPTPASRDNLVRAVQGNPAFEAIFGLTRDMGTVAGYTAYKTMFSIVILAAIWGLLTATKVLRGEEEAGRWEVLLAGRTTAGGAAAQVVAGLSVGIIGLWIPTALLVAAAGRSSTVAIGLGTSLFFAAAVASVAVMFMAVGVLASQLAASRHDANLLGAGVLVVSYLIRMAADSDPTIGWVRWVSPLGWVEELRALTGSRPTAFAPIVMFTALLLVVAVQIAARRDIGASAFAGRQTHTSRTFLLGGQAGLTVRLARPIIAAWLGALTATGLAFGLVTQAAGKSLDGSPTLERVIARLGATGATAVTYLGYVFVIAAGLIAVAAAGQISAIRNEEAAGHLDNLLVRLVPRGRWLAARLAVGLALVVLASVLTGIAAWVGAATEHAAVGFGQLLRAGLNVAPPAVFVLGIGGLAFGTWPRAAVGITYGLVIWSFLVEVFASISDTASWLRDTSPLLHITPAPAAAPNWAAAAWLVGLGAAAGVAGVIAFSRRDIVTA